MPLYGVYLDTATKSQNTMKLSTEQMTEFKDVPSILRSKLEDVSHSYDSSTSFLGIKTGLIIIPLYSSKFSFNYL